MMKNKQMNNINIVVPVHTYDENIKEHLDTALKSVENQKKIDGKLNVTLVYSSQLKNNELFKENVLENNRENINLTLLENSGDTSFQSQVNYAIENIKEDYVLILEFDDELSNSYLYTANKHIKKLNDVAVFLNIILEIDKNDNIVKLTNEMVWSKQFVGENGILGYLNSRGLKEYTDFKIAGAVIKKDLFKEIGFLKNNIKLTFIYEFIMRVLNNGYNIYTIPTFGCKHLVGREGSLFESYLNEFNNEDIKFWFKTAKKESNFPDDRPVMSVG